MKFSTTMLCMASIFVFWAAMVTAQAPGSAPAAPDTIHVFNGKNLDGFYKFIKDRGRDQDPKQVFTVQNGLLRISGEEWGCVTSDQEFENYRLVVEFKWGELTHANRKDAARDSGVLVNSVGEDGGYSDVWMHSIECQLIEGGTGDIIVVGDGSDQFQVTCPTAPELQGESPVFQPGGQMRTVNTGRVNWFGRDPEWKDVKGFRGKRDVEKPVGEWNRYEITVQDGEITVMLNGVEMNHCYDVQPRKGRLQIQSEGAELFVRTVDVTPLPAKAASAAGEEQTYAEKLGWPKGSKVVIFHVDDAGMCHDANMGAIEAIEKGVATSTSVMFPCPWVVEFAKYEKEHPEVDMGVHCTLTSEWDAYRWGGVAGKQVVPGLTDSEGCLWPSGAEVVAHATADEVETELRAQLDRCRTMGLAPTHLDTHMGVVFDNPEFLERYIKIGAENGIPVMVPGGHAQFIGKESPELTGAVLALGEKVWALGLPVLDDVHTGYGCESPKDKKPQIIEFLRTMKPGLTQFIVHCTRPSDTFQYISSSGGTRLAELEALTSPEVKKAVADEQIILTTWRELKQRRDAVK